MLRNRNEQPLYWADHTMSIMQERKLEACADRLNAALPYGLFDLPDDRDVETLWTRSYDAQEHPRMQRLHTAEELRAQVLADLPAEMALTSIHEHLLLERVCAMGGRMPLMDLEESRPAESLVRRMWCVLEWEDDRPHLRLPDALLLPGEAVFKSGAGWCVQLENGEICEVELGVTTDSQVQILSGLAEGDIVVY